MQKEKLKPPAANVKRKWCLEIKGDGMTHLNCLPRNKQLHNSVNDGMVEMKQAA